MSNKYIITDCIILLHLYLSHPEYIIKLNKLPIRGILAVIYSIWLLQLKLILGYDIIEALVKSFDLWVIFDFALYRLLIGQYLQSGNIILLLSSSMAKKKNKQTEKSIDDEIKII